MANNINWNAGKPIPTKGGLKVQPYLTTIGPRSSGTLFSKTGYIAFSGNLNFAYTVKDDGTVEYAEYKGGIVNGTRGRQFKTLEDAIDNGFITGSALEAFRTRLSTDLTEKNTNILDGTSQPSPFFLANNPGWKPPTQGTAPPPAAAGAQSGTNPGPSGIGSTFDTSNTPGLGDLTSKFEDKGNSFKGIEQFLYYPSNIAGSEQDKITISQITYVPGDVTNALTGTLGNRELDFTNNSKVKTLGMVILPIPNELSEANQTAWGEDSLSTISAALMGKGVDLVGDISSGRLGATLGNLKNFVDNIKTDGGAINNRLKQFLTVNAAASVLKLGGINVNPEAYISRVTGTAINPNLELLFNGPKLRQFGFQFKLTPRDEKEARNIRSIIKFFKKGMAPRRSTKQDLSIFLGAPNVFRIKFTSGKNGKELDSVGKIKTCALQSFSANYTPDGFYAAYNDPKAGGSQPIAVVINLGFAELTPIFNDEYDGDSPSVGPDFVQENAKAFNVEQPKSTTPPPAATPTAQRQSPRPGQIPGLPNASLGE